MGSPRSSYCAPYRLLVGLCGTRNTVDLTCLRALGDPVFLDAFQRLGDRHKVLGLALASLERAREAKESPASAAGPLAHALKSLRRHADLWDLEVRRVVAAFQDSGCDPVLLKGAALRATLFREPVERRIGDLDVLVPKEQADAAIRALRRRGYEPPAPSAATAFRERYYHVPLVHPRGFMVEVHWELVQPGWPAVIPAADFLDNAVLVRYGGVAVRVPRIEHTLVHVLSQAIKEPLRLLRLVDVDRIAGLGAAFDWRFFEDCIRRAGLANAAAFTLQLSSAVFGTAVPSERVARLRPSAAARLHLALLDPVGSLERGTFDERILERKTISLWLVAGARRRARHLLSIVTGEEQPLKWTVPLYQRLPRRAWKVVSLALSPVKAVALLAYHLWIYTRATTALFSSRARDRIRFWPTDAAAAPPVHMHHGVAHAEPY